MASIINITIIIPTIIIIIIVMTCFLKKESTFLFTWLLEIWLLNSSLVDCDSVMSLNMPSSLDVNWQPHSVWKENTCSVIEMFTDIRIIIVDTSLLVSYL